MNVDVSIFKSYDIRGIYPSQIDEKLSEIIGRCFAKYLNFPQKVIVARDGRLSGESMKNSLIIGLTKVGVSVVDIDMASTDMFYYACQTRDLPGISVTASHNPKEYTGFKMVKKIPELLSGDSGIKEIKDYILADDLPADSANPGQVENLNIMDEFINYILSLVDVSKFKKLKIVADPANGMVGPILQKLSQRLPTIEFVPLYWEVDGNFPNHGGDPLLEENRITTQKFVVDQKADLGVMFDPDGDRFFTIDNQGHFVSGDFLTALLSTHFLKKYPNCTIIYDIRASKAVREIVAANGGKALANRVGHTHIKARMKTENAFFGGEISGHYYFKEFFLCDSGAVSLIYLLEFLSISEKSLETMVNELSSQYFISGEINNKVTNVPKIMAEIESIYGPQAVQPVEKMDGLTFEMGDWRFNLRSSNTEPLLRLNLEGNSSELMEQKRDEILALIIH